MTSIILLATLAALQSPLDPVALFVTADRNNDGVVTRAEFLVARNINFDRLDRDRNGTLQAAELSTAAPGMTARMAVRSGFGLFDQNGDGRLSRQELRQGPTVAFDRADRDGNDRLTRAEIAAATGR